MMHLPRRTIGFFAVGLALVALIALSPNPVVEDASLYCKGQPIRHFPNMPECPRFSQVPCVCIHEASDWFHWYWRASPLILGTIGALVIGSGSFSGLVIVPLSI